MQWIALALILSLLLWKWPRPALIFCGVLGIVGLIIVAAVMGPEIYKKQQQEKDKTLITVRMEHDGAFFIEKLANTSDRYLDAVTVKTAFSSKNHSSTIASSTKTSDQIVAPGETVETQHIFLQIGENIIVPDTAGKVFIKAKHPPQMVFDTVNRFLGKCIPTAEVGTDEEMAAFIESMYAMTPDEMNKECRHVYLYSAVTLYINVENATLR